MNCAMSLADGPVPMETLLTHRAWVRRLAWSLVRDDQAADDVEQQTWLAAMQSPPRAGSSVRAWLARVVRNQVFNAHRAERRRDAHENAAARPGAARSPAEVVAEAESHKRLVLAVLALDEPYRSTVLLRWFEDLQPRAVAQRMNVPVETVRTRLRRAYETLRDRLGSGHGGGRAGCILALAPLTGLKHGAVSAGATAAKIGGGLGGTMMGTKASFAAAGLAVGIAFAGGMYVREPTPPVAQRSEIADLRQRVRALEATQPTEQESKLAAVEVNLGGRIEALEAALAAATGASGRGAGTGDPESERKRLEAMPDDELLDWVKVLISTDMRGVPVNGTAVLDACQVLLSRPLDAPKRSEALTYKGIGYRVLMDFAAAEAACRDAASLVDARTREGRWANLQVAWTVSRRGDPRAAAETFLLIANDDGATEQQRAWGRVYAASHFDTAGDVTRALAEYRTVVEQFGKSEDVAARKAADLAREAIVKADGR